MNQEERERERSGRKRVREEERRAVRLCSGRKNCRMKRRRKSSWGEVKWTRSEWVSQYTYKEEIGRKRETWWWWWWCFDREKVSPGLVAMAIIIRHILSLSSLQLKTDQLSSFSTLLPITFITCTSNTTLFRYGMGLDPRIILMPRYGSQDLRVRRIGPIFCPRY